MSEPFCIFCGRENGHDRLPCAESLVQLLQDEVELLKNKIEEAAEHRRNELSADAARWWRQQKESENDNGQA
jgi:hypothetical protein